MQKVRNAKRSNLFVTYRVGDSCCSCLRWGAEDVETIKYHIQIEGKSDRSLARVIIKQLSFKIHSSLSSFWFACHHKHYAFGWSLNMTYMVFSIDAEAGENLRYRLRVINPAWETCFLFLNFMRIIIIHSRLLEMFCEGMTPDHTWMVRFPVLSLKGVNCGRKHPSIVDREAA